MNFKLTANRKHRYISINNVRFFTFKVGELPKEFASIDSERSIKQWLNYRGYTLIHEAFLSDIFTQR